MKRLLVLCCALTAVYCVTCPKDILSTSDDFRKDLILLNTEKRDTREVEAAAELLRTIKAESLTFTNCPVSESLISYKPQWVADCNPCRSSYSLLHRFYGNRCFVILPEMQQVRIVKCSYKTCEAPCPCGDTKCLHTRWTRVWFWAWCSENVGIWLQGVSYRYMYLPQQCLCHNKIGPKLSKIMKN